jgi:hypothetical protein
MLTVVSHDAGGAELISSYVRQQGIACIYVLEGPARHIFERKLGPIQIAQLESSINLATSLLCGTSWQSDLEFNAIGLARSLGKRSTSFLDHWVDYRERFTRGTEVHLPDEIWVSDKLAQKLATEAIPEVPAFIVENPYFADLSRELESINPSYTKNIDKLSVLYICEPVREHMRLQFGNENHLGYVEEGALAYFLDHIDIIGKPVERIVIRPHPSESLSKYEWARTQFNMPIFLGGDQTLLQEIVDSDVVVGCESMAMVVGLLAGKRVISCIPPKGRPCVLPYSEIEHINYQHQSTLGSHLKNIQWSK